MDRLNILVLHRLGDPRVVPNFLRHHVFALRACVPQHNYVYHDATLPIPTYIRETRFDAIVLDVTFLCVRWLPAPGFDRIKQDFDFVKQSDAVKLAFPQDEYDCSQLLDEWMTDWRVDVVFSVISNDWDTLYPIFQKMGDIRLGYTGYVDESLVDVESRPFDGRVVDVGYRAKRLPPYFGRLGEVKWTIGRDVARLAGKAGLRTDIVLGEDGTLHGDAWTDFINGCKFTLGANSGSSLLDPRGDIQRRVRAFLERHPSATFEEVEAHCFPGLDQQYSFTAISPRVIEAALLSSCQILVEGEYSGIVKPWEHYIPIRPDASDFPQVLDAMRDRRLVDRLISNCRETILSTGHLRYRHLADNVIDLIATHKKRKHVTSNCDAVGTVARRYEQEMPRKYADHWRRQAVRAKLVGLLDRSPAISGVVRAVWSSVRG